MPRKTRIDAPEALHHIIVRGIERKEIFKDDPARVKFLATGRRDDLIGGGLIRRHGGWTAVEEYLGTKAYQEGDERILGDGDFVEQVLRESEEHLERKCQLKAQGIDFDKVVERVAYLLKIPPAAGAIRGKLEANGCGPESQSAVNSAIDRGKRLAEDMSCMLIV